MLRQSKDTICLFTVSPCLSIYTDAILFLARTELISELLKQMLSHRSKECSTKFELGRLSRHITVACHLGSTASEFSRWRHVELQVHQLIVNSGAMFLTQILDHQRSTLITASECDLMSSCFMFGSSVTVENVESFPTCHGSKSLHRGTGNVLCLERCWGGMGRRRQ